MSHHSAFGGKAFGVLGFLFQIRNRDEHGEIGIGVAGALEIGIELLLDEFPDGIAPGLDDHAAANLGILGKVGSLDYLLIPLRKVLRACGRNCVLLSHGGILWIMVKMSMKISLSGVIALA